MMNAGALAIVAASVIVAVVAAVRSGRLVCGVPMMLDLWIAAGLLRLAHTSSWTALASAAALIAIRKLVASALG